jgi:hypothetical protein
VLKRAYEPETYLMAFASQKKQVRSRNNRGVGTTCKTRLKVSTGRRTSARTASNDLTLTTVKAPKVSGTHTSKRGACVSLRLQN